MTVQVQIIHYNCNYARRQCRKGLIPHLRTVASPVRREHLASSHRYGLQLQIMVHSVPNPQYFPFHPANLRQANRHYASLFLNELLPSSFRSIITQIDNLRSNNSKEALTLVTEIFEHQKIETVQPDIIKALIAALLAKSVSEKTFLKNQALKGLNNVPSRWNDGALEEFCSQTQAQNGQISELAIKLMA